MASSARRGATGANRDERGANGHGPDRGHMVTIALHGEQADRLRTLASNRQLSLAKLVVAMMEVYQAYAEG